MNKKTLCFSGLLLFLACLGGCTGANGKSGTISSVYIVTSLLSLALLAGYCLLIKKREPWFMVLFTAVTVINIGYLCLSISPTLNEALLSNRIAYLGSVFLPVSMLMIILKNCKIKINRWVMAVILAISIAVFLVAASPGYLDVYYKNVSLTTIGGATALDKEYGPLHKLYLVYLVGHFCAMLGTIVYARISKKINSSLRAVLLLSCVLVNIGVWFMEQLIDLGFEFLSISYIVTELFLLGISVLLQDITPMGAPSHINQEDKNFEVPTLKSSSTSAHPQDALRDADIQEKAEFLSSSLHTLTPTESHIYELYIQGKSTKEVMSQLSITENTLKYHNRNIYSKLGVATRKELIAVSLAKEVGLKS